MTGSLISRAEKRTADAKRAADDWNAKHPVGTRVRFWTMVKRGDPTGETPTIEPACVLGDTATVPIYREGRGRDCIALTHVEVVS